MQFNRSEWIINMNQSKRAFPLPTVFFILEEIIPYFPLVSTILGFIGFLGNLITFIQPKLRSNSCCIYIFSSSIADLTHLMINVFPEYLVIKHRYDVPWNYTESLCKLYYFLYNFLPHLAINFLLLSLIDRFACTCSMTSEMYRFHQFKVVPWSIITVTIISLLLSLYGPILAYRGLIACSYRQPRTYAILNISMNGILQPILMLIFAALTYRNVRLSQVRVSHVTVPNVNRFRNKFVAMVITQVILTAFFSLQWMVGQTYVLFNIDQITTLEELFTILLILSFTISFYAFNNVKLFYFSMITSRHYRRMFLKGCKRLVFIH